MIPKPPPPRRHVDRRDVGSIVLLAVVLPSRRLSSIPVGEVHAPFALPAARTPVAGTSHLGDQAMRLKVEEPTPERKHVDPDPYVDVLPFVIALVDRLQVASLRLIRRVVDPRAPFAAHSPVSQRATFHSRRKALPQARQTSRLTLFQTTRCGSGLAQTQTCSRQKTFGSCRCIERSSTASAPTRQVSRRTLR
jgi:hypothetical protein